LGEFIELGCQIRLGRRGHLRWGRGVLRGPRLLLCLCIRSALLVGLIVTCLLLGCLVRIFLLLVMMYSSSRSCYNRCRNCGTSYGSSNCSSSHHVGLSSLGSRFRLRFHFRGWTGVHTGDLFHGFDHSLMRDADVHH
jgi:hypothetical protein